MLKSPLRYPGGKAKLLKVVSEIISEARLLGCAYAEPYAGGAGLALSLLSLGYVSEIRLNDIDPAIYAFWVAVLDHSDEFCRLIRDVPLSVEEWHRQREVRALGDLTSPLELGFSTFYLNRTNRSGIIEGAGPIGGYAQNGKWKIDARFNKDRLIEVVQLLQIYRKSIVVTHLDAIEFIKSTVEVDNMFLYLDLPYYEKGDRLYRNHYSHIDHKNVSKLMDLYRRKAWIVSYDDSAEIRNLYKTFKSIEYSLGYSASSHKAGREIMFFSDGISSDNNVPTRVFG